jgi:beta-galactosidase
MDWTDHEPGQKVQVRAYANVDSVELFLNGRSLGVRHFDRKTTTFGTHYLETTEATHDDKTVTSGPYPGSYTSPNGSAGNLHLTWEVPFARGRLVAVARRGGQVVARDEVDSAGLPYRLRLRPDRRRIAADDRSLVYFTADVVARNGVVVPDADNLIHYAVTGGRIVGLDNGREEDAEGYKGDAHTAFNGKGLAIVQSGARPGPIRLTATSAGLRGASSTVLSVGRHRGGGPVSPPPPTAQVPPIPLPAGPVADASYSGAQDTVPQAMLDGNTTSGGWSNYYLKDATALLPPFSLAHPAEWVSVTWPQAQTLGTVTAYFTTDATHELPATLAVRYWDGRRFVPVGHPHIDWAGASNQPTTISFDRVTTTRIRLDMTSRAPDTGHGFLEIAELQFPGSA